MVITADQAREFWQHPTQWKMGVSPSDLHDDGFVYVAAKTLCLAFHRANWPGIWMVHLGAKPEAWGHTVPQALALLAEFWAGRSVDRIVAWIDESNRPACRLARECGFEIDGRLPGPNPAIMYGWEQPCQ